MNNQCREFKGYIDIELKKRYPIVEINNKSFYNKDDMYFILSIFPTNDALVVEYAFSKDEAVNNVLEDGDVFDIVDFTKETLCKAIINEIEK